MNKSEANDFWDYALIPLLVCLVILLAIIVIPAHDSASGYRYEYVDLGGNTGIADKCGTNRGTMWCTSGDRHITVREYAKRRKND